MDGSGWMKCQQCVKEHHETMSKCGYGYSYIGMANQCHRHPTPTPTPRPSPPLAYPYPWFNLGSNKTN